MKAYILSLGCPKNEVDSERLVNVLYEAGYEFTDNLQEADIAVVNTCAFILPAVEESIDAILDLEEFKEHGYLKRFYVVGCLVSRYGDSELKREVPLCDGFFGVDCHKLFAEEVFGISSSGKRLPLPYKSPHVRYLKITEGCNNRCSYCTIPKIRGPLKSCSEKAIVEEFEQLLQQGAKEICLVGQDIASYGKDIDCGVNNLKDLLKLLSKSFPKDLWVRLLYLHPANIEFNLIDFIASNKNILNYLDIPIQHASDRMLGLMNRKVTKAQMFELFNYIRSIDPTFALRSTVLVGHPGETKEDLLQLCDFIERVEFDRLGGFTYWPEEGTASLELGDDISISEKERRLRQVLEIQQEISFKRNSQLLGKVLKVMVDEIVFPDYLIGRSYREAPEIDGIITVYASKETLSNLSVGSFVDVKIQSIDEHDLEGEVITVV